MRLKNCPRKGYDVCICNSVAVFDYNSYKGELKRAICLSGVNILLFCALKLSEPFVEKSWKFANGKPPILRTIKVKEDIEKISCIHEPHGFLTLPFLTLTYNHAVKPTFRILAVRIVLIYKGANFYKYSYL